MSCKQFKCIFFTEKVKISKREAARRRKEKRYERKMVKAMSKINNYALKQLKKIDVGVNPELQQYRELFFI